MIPKMYTKYCAVFKLFLLIGVLFCACGGQVNMNGIMLGIPKKITPYDIQSNVEWYLIKNLGITLVAYDEHDKIIPNACKSWSITNKNRTYIFELREDLKDSAGQGLDVKSWVRTLRGILEYGQTQDSFVRAVELPDNIYADGKKLVIRLKYEMPSLLHRLTSPEFVLLSDSQNLSDYSPSNFKVTTGHYYISSYKDNEILLKSNKYHSDYDGSQPITIHLYDKPKNLDTLVSLYVHKKIDFSLFPSFPFDEDFRKIEKLMQSGEISIANTPLQSTGMIILNSRSNVFKDINIRKSFLAKWQKQKISEFNTIFSRRSYQFMPQGFVGYSQPLNDNPYIPNSTASLPKKINGISTPVVRTAKIDQIVNKYSHLFGVNTTINEADYDVFYDQAILPQNDFSIFTTGVDVRDVLGILMLYFIGKNDGGALIYDPSGKLNKFVDKLVNVREKKELHRNVMEFQKILLEQALVVPLITCEPNILIYQSDFYLPNNFNRKDKFLLHMFRKQ